MHEWQSLSHVKWECKYHIVIVPKYRRKRLYGRLRNQIGSILKDLCKQKGIELIEKERARFESIGCTTGSVQRMGSTFGRWVTG